MITVGMDYKIVSGKDDEFIAVFKKVMGIMAELPGHAETHLYRDVDQEHDYLVVSEWTDEAAFNSFIESERFKNVVTWGKENVLRTRPKHEIYGGSAPGEGCPAGTGR